MAEIVRKAPLSEHPKNAYQNLVFYQTQKKENNPTKENA